MILQSHRGSSARAASDPKVHIVMDVSSVKVSGSCKISITNRDGSVITIVTDRKTDVGDSSNVKIDDGFEIVDPRSKITPTDDSPKKVNVNDKMVDTIPLYRLTRIDTDGKHRKSQLMYHSVRGCRGIKNHGEADVITVRLTEEEIGKMARHDFCGTPGCRKEFCRILKP